MEPTILPFRAELKGPALIRHIMKEQGLRQKDIARSIGISEAQLSLMLREERSTTSEVALQLANKYGGNPDDFTWNPGLKSHSRGLVAGDALQKLCKDGGVLSDFEAGNIMPSFVAVRIAHLVNLIQPDRPDEPNIEEIKDQPLEVRFGQVAQVSIREDLKLPSDISAQVKLLEAKVYEGFSAPSFMKSPASPSFPPISLQYLGAEPAELTADDPFFSVSFYKL